MPKSKIFRAFFTFFSYFERKVTNIFLYLHQISILNNIKRLKIMPVGIKN
jgi:hypothetical protein